MSAPSHKRTFSAPPRQVVGTAGDSVLAEFGSAVEAVRCAVEIQQDLGKRNADLPEDLKMRFRNPAGDVRPRSAI